MSVEWFADHDVESAQAADPFLAGIQRFPVKSLDPESKERATLVTDGALEGDREWAILDQPATEPYDPQTADVSGTGDYLNGKKTAAIHRIRSRFHPRSADGPAVTLWDVDASEAKRRFPLFDGRTQLSDSDTMSDDQHRAIQRQTHADVNEWLSEQFDRSVSVHWDGGGHHDDRARHGPTVISTATLREVAAWFGFSVESARRRFRANLEVGGVPPFWEDRLFTDTGEVVSVRIGEATIEGIHPCQRCVVPSRDPDTGTETPQFRQTFVRRRRETLPPWTACDRFDHPFRLMVNTRVPDVSSGDTIAVGDSLEILEIRPE